jgi:hypothetical protein
MSTVVKNDKSADLFKKISQIKKGFVTIGVHEGAGSYPEGGPTVMQVALWNEFGTEDGIPERSFFRSAIDDNREILNKYKDELLTNIFDKNWPVEKALKALGFRIQILVQNKIRSNIPPPNALSTLEMKKYEGQGQKTLVATGLLLRSITYKVKL